MRIAIMTDTNSGIMEQQAKEHGIFIVPMPVIIDGTVFFEGESIHPSVFFDALYSDKSVTTSQPAPGDVTDRWDAVLAQGYDAIVYLPMASALSDSCATAMALAADYGARVQVVDNARISITLWDAALTAKKLADKGMHAAEIKAYLERTADDAVIYIAVDTLYFLKRGGRISASTAAIGSVLNIKPILTIPGGKLESYAKVRGMKKTMPMMIKALKQDIATRFHNDAANCTIATAGAGLSESERNAYLSALRAAFPQHNVVYYPLPMSICTHTGRGAIGTAVIYHRD